MRILSCFSFLNLFFLVLCSAYVNSQRKVSGDSDMSIMLALRKTLNNPPQLEWSDPDPCKWNHVVCSEEKRVTRIQIGHQNLQGTLPPNMSGLAQLERLELQWNNISGPLPSLSDLNYLQVLMLSNNLFTSIPADFFNGMSSLQSFEIDNNPFTTWVIPESLKNASALQNFSANSANISGKIPDFLCSNWFPGLINLHLALNNLEGDIPASFSDSQIESFWVNGQRSKMTGGIDVIQNMTSLKEIWLHSNSFSGPLPDFSGLNNLESFSIRDNAFTGPVPASLVNLMSLKSVNLSNNFLQGAVPEFEPSVKVDMTKNTNSFCLDEPRNCDSRVYSLLSIVKSMNYPQKFGEDWKGNDPCVDWFGITCNNENITVINFQNLGLTGTVSPVFATLTSLQRLVLSDNNLTGTIPDELTTLPSFTELDVSYNDIHGKIPVFRNNMNLRTNGNPNLGNEMTNADSPTNKSSSTANGRDLETSGRKESKSSTAIIIVCVISGVFVFLLIGLGSFCLYKSRHNRFSRVQSPTAMVIHPRHSGSENDSIKITVVGSSVNIGALSENHPIVPNINSDHNDIQMVEGGNMVISIQVLRCVTNNFAPGNILGQGGFGTVYKGDLHDGTKIAVKRMESSVIVGNGLTEFKSEIVVLTKVRHRHLVALLGYCLDGDEKLLVYEYMPQGTLSRYLFNWAHEDLKPLDWNRRLTIALDVARGVEYLHGLAHQSFIHRDLKPSNILLGDDMRAKVSDFGLVRLAPEGKGSIETRIAGTFGYLAPEYAVTGRVTTKVDVFSFGVILMELITGRKALDEAQPEESMHLVTWFRRMNLNKETFRKAIDPTMDIKDDETLASINTVAELAGYSCAREPYQRPDMGHAVNVLSSLVEIWKPSDQTSDDLYGIDLEMSLPQALKKWQDFEGRINMDSSSSSFLPSLDNTQTSIPIRPYGFAESFTSADGR